MDQEESNTLGEVLAQLKFQVMPTLREIKEVTEKQEKHLGKLNGTVGACLQNDAVFASKLENVQKDVSETAEKQVASENRNNKIIITLGTLIIIALVAALLDLLSKIHF